VPRAWPRGHGTADMGNATSGELWPIITALFTVRDLVLYVGKETALTNC